MNSRSKFREFFEVFLISILCALFARTFILQTFQIPSQSMEGGLLVGDQIVVNKLIYHSDSPPVGIFGSSFLPTREIRRGDIAVFQVPSQNHHHFIKRCLGLPGETIEIDSGNLIIDGRIFAEPYIQLSTPWRHGSFGPYTVPEGHYFFLGDHRDASRDSRTWGSVPARWIQARALFIYWSFGGEVPQEQKEWSMIYMFLDAFSRSRWGRYPRWIR